MKTKYLSITGVFAAIIALMTAYICHIPIGLNGGYIHFGDTLIYLAATLLPRPYAMLAAGIGGGLADLLTAPLWAPATIIIKVLLATLFTNKTTKIITPRNIIATIGAFLISGIGYLTAEYFIFGNAAIVTSLVSSVIQSTGSAIFFIIIGIALDKIRVKSRLAIK